LHEFGHKTWETFGSSLSAAKLDQDVFSLDITEISQRLPEYVGIGPRIAGILTSSHNSYPRDFLLQRLGWDAKR
jgi:hypothetical protein